MVSAVMPVFAPPTHRNTSSIPACPREEPKMKIVAATAPGAAQGSKKAMLRTEVLAALPNWVCDNPIQNGANARSALIWDSRARKDRPRLQLVQPDEPCFRVCRTETPVPDARWRQFDAVPGCDAQQMYLARLDRYATDVAQRRCAEWFGKPLSEDSIGAMYRPIMHPDRRTLRLRLPVDSCRIWCVGPNNTYQPGSLEDIAEGLTVLPCVTVNGIYFKAREMGLSLTCTDILVYSAPDVLPFHLLEPLQRAEPPDAHLPEHEECEGCAVPSLQMGAAACPTGYASYDDHQQA